LHLPTKGALHIMSCNDKVLRLVELENKILDVDKKHQTVLKRLEKRIYRGYRALALANRDYKKTLAVSVKELRLLQIEISNG
jgi:hypothetical protein